MTKELVDRTHLQNNISRIKAGCRGIPDSIAVKMARGQVARANGDNETADKLLKEFTAEITKGMPWWQRPLWQIWVAIGTRWVTLQDGR
jgi:hypothetical protein